MSIIKNTPNFLKHTGLSFTTIINQMMALIPDAAALGIYCYLSSKPENWNISHAELQKRFGKGRDYIRNKINILKEIGAIKTSAIKDEKGKIMYWETTLVNLVGIHNTENPYSGNKTHITENPECGQSRHLEKPALVIKEIKNKRDNKNKRESVRKKPLTSLPLSLSFQADEKREALIKDTAQRSGISAADLLTKFKNITHLSQKKSIDWQLELENFLINEKSKQISNYTSNNTQELRPSVPFYGPGHPTWDALNEWNNEHQNR